MEQNVEINIVDCIMGAGKTQSAINYINSSSDEKKFIYVTPYLTEVNRIIDSCKEKNFKQPEKFKNQARGHKIVGLKHLLNKGYNVATTHALFQRFDDEIMDLCYDQGYELIMDEVAEVIKPYNIEKRDLEIVLKEFVVIQDDGILKWRDDERYSGRFKDVMALCDIGCLAMYDNKIMIWLFPIRVFRAFRYVYILTYMFNAQTQKYYYDFYDIKYKYLYVKGDNINNYNFTEDPQTHISKYDYRKLITIFEDKKMNMIGDSDYSLSKQWYERNKTNVLMKQLKNNAGNFFKNKKIVYDEDNDMWEKSTSSNNIWTTFKSYKKFVSGLGYARSFVSSNIRATNEYMDRTAIAYLVNKFFNPYVKKFFIQNGVSVDEDAYALSEMLQFIWRSAIRQGKHVTIYIPSKRMRALLIEWINSQNYEE